jgi:hypothetical protein
LDKGHIVPEKVAKGRGDRTKFNQTDTLGLLLFQLLCDAGFTQNEAGRIVGDQPLDPDSIEKAPVLVAARRREGKFLTGVTHRTDAMPTEIPVIARPNGYMLVVNLSDLAEHAEVKLALLEG